MSELFEPVGIASVLDDEPGFSPVVFRKENSFYFANSEKDGTSVSSFSPADIREKEFESFKRKVDSSTAVDKNDLERQTQKLPPAIEVGDQNIFAFVDQSGSKIVGTRSQISKILRKKFRHLSSFPFAQLEVASFLDVPQLKISAIRRSSIPVANITDGSVSRAYTSLSAEFSVGLDRYGDLAALDFSKAIVSYYRLFHRLNHVSDQKTFRRLRHRFRSVSVNILPYLMDLDFLESFSKLSEISSGEQRSFDEESTGDAAVNALTGFGVSHSTARKYAQRLLEQPISGSLPGASEVADAVANISSMNYRNAVLLGKLSRLEKKQTKRDIDLEFMELLFGFLILISHDLKMMRLGESSIRVMLSSVGDSIGWFGSLRARRW